MKYDHRLFWSGNIRIKLRRGQGAIPLTRTDDNFTPQEVEQKTAELAYFLRQNSFLYLFDLSRVKTQPTDKQTVGSYLRSAAGMVTIRNNQVYHLQAASAPKWQACMVLAYGFPILLGRNGRFQLQKN
ncbi:hypothetical protein E3N88_18928 [Mikania micrantha]|uniref:Uncharacterized protein n=1 Tax=Mikania micrantha TaxID=192012 RepID=A0A5N6NLT9_9ASTR|nr:hypothetical protein E3N88_18928 [Mikania micrantha]